MRRCGRCDDPGPAGVRVWIAIGHTDMRGGMNGLALQVQEALRRDPHAGDLYVFRGAQRRSDQDLWHDGIGMSLYAKRLERGRFIWPSPADGRARSRVATGLHARRDRLAEPAVTPGARRGRLSLRPIELRAAFEASLKRAGFVISFGAVDATPEDLPDDIAALRGGADSPSRAEAARAGSRPSWRWPRPRPPTIRP